MASLWNPPSGTFVFKSACFSTFSLFYLAPPYSCLGLVGLTETWSDLHRQQCSLLPSSFFQSPWYIFPTFPSSHGLLWRGAEINALLASEPGGRHLIHHKKATLAMPERDYKQQTHCRCRWKCSMQTETKRRKWKRKQRVEKFLRFERLTLLLMFVQPRPIYIQWITSQWPYISKSSYVMASHESFIKCPHKEIRSFST